MPIWPSFTIFGPKTPNLPVQNGVEDLPDFYRMLDPLFTNRKRDYGGVYPRYRDEEGVFHHPTYRPFPPLVPPPKKLPPDERPTYVERMRLPPPEELPPTDPVPEIPPWKQCSPKRKKKTKKQSTDTGLSKIPEIVNSNTVNSAVDELQDRSQSEASFPVFADGSRDDTKTTGSEQDECCSRLLVAQAQEMLGRFIEAVCSRTCNSTTTAM